MRFPILFGFLLLISFQASAQTKKDTLTIIGVGDIMMGSNYPENMLPANDGAFLLKEV